MRPRSTLVTLVTLGSLGAACNAISGLDEDYRLTPGVSPSAEGGSSEASVARDGDVDAPTEGGRPDVDVPDASVGCPTGALFCDDFEGANNWTRQEITPAGSPLIVEDTIGFGGSKGLRAHANASNQSRKVVRWKSVATSFAIGSSIKLSFRFKVTSSGLNYFVIGAIQVNGQPTGNAEYGLASYKTCPSTSPCFDENNPEGEGGGHAFGGEMSYGINQWYRAEIVVQRKDASTYLGSVIVNGQTQSALDMNGATYFAANPSVVEVGVGVFFTGNDNGLEGEVVLDDVVVVNN